MAAIATLGEAENHPIPDYRARNADSRGNSCAEPSGLTANQGDLRLHRRARQEVQDLIFRLEDHGGRRRTDLAR